MPSLVSFICLLYQHWKKTPTPYFLTFALCASQVLYLFWLSSFLDKLFLDDQCLWCSKHFPDLPGWICPILGVHSPKDISWQMLVEAGRDFLLMLTRIILWWKDKDGKMMERDTTANEIIPHWNKKPVPFFPLCLKRTPQFKDKL